MFTPEDPNAHRAAGHRIECGNTADTCHTCHMTIARVGYMGMVLPLNYTPLDDVSSWTL
jgi:hypothetical protein